MRIAITGANGQVGQSLQARLKNSEHDVLALDRQSLDITDLSAVEQALLAFKPDIVINAAAYTAVDKAESDVEQSHAINVAGPRNLAKVTNALDAAIIHISTDYVFQGNGEASYLESDVTAPQSVYGETKLLGEQAVASENSRHIIVRTAWVFGEYGNNFVKTMLRLGATRDALSVVADQYGAPTYAGDIANALITIAESLQKADSNFWGVYHFSGAPYTNWHDFACAIFARASEIALLNKPVPALSPITTSEYPTPAKRPANSRLNCEKIHRVFGIAPSDWQLALRDLRAYIG